jgi:DUF971 family protein
VVSEVAKAKHSAARPEVTYREDGHLIEVRGVAPADAEAESDGRDGGGGAGAPPSALTLAPAELRRACRCAGCVEELTGRQILAAGAVPESVRPARIAPTGNYALSVDWSDGHRSLYPYRQIRSLLQDKRRRERQPQQQDPQEAPGAGASAPTPEPAMA